METPERKGAKKCVQAIYLHENGQIPRAVKGARRRKQLGPKQALDHTHRPRPPSCQQSHIELKQQ